MGRVVDTTKTGIVSDPKYKHRRHWLPRSANIAPDPDGQTRLEGVVLVDAEDQDIISQGGKIGWERVKAVMVCEDEDEEANGETKGQSRLFRLIRTVFHTQPTRRFVTGILQRGYTMSVFCMDRTGGGSSESFDVNEKTRALPQSHLLAYDVARGLYWLRLRDPIPFATRTIAKRNRRNHIKGVRHVHEQNAKGDVPVAR